MKIAALWLMAARLRPHRPRDGMVLAAAVGFAALESPGYALTALLTVKGLSLTDLVRTEVLRGLLAPFGHGLWTAVAGGVLFAASARSGWLRLTGWVVAARLGLSVLHALWDAMHSVAAALAPLSTEPPGSGTCWRRGTCRAPPRRRPASSPASSGAAGWWSPSSRSAGCVSGPEPHALWRDRHGR
ncbi:PrsW family glutamic-type intramembrane protease [Streptomyces sp. NPDC058374]|uniref:PrsW family glutamic-type intramembrane protease n=1 Tax=unclassified Streptomyces TaxID=2593676 RepID=UPI003655B136